MTTRWPSSHRGERLHLITLYIILRRPSPTRRTDARIIPTTAFRTQPRRTQLAQCGSVEFAAKHNLIARCVLHLTPGLYDHNSQRGTGGKRRTNDNHGSIPLAILSFLFITPNSQLPTSAYSPEPRIWNLECSESAGAVILLHSCTRPLAARHIQVSLSGLLCPTILTNSPP